MTTMSTSQSAIGLEAAVRFKRDIFLPSANGGPWLFAPKGDIGVVARVYPDGSFLVRHCSELARVSTSDIELCSPAIRQTSPRFLPGRTRGPGSVRFIFDAVTGKVAMCRGAAVGLRWLANQLETGAVQQHRLNWSIVEPPPGTDLS